MRAAAIALALGVVVLLVSAGADARPAAQLGGDWARFGYSASRQSAGPVATGITAANVAHLSRQQIQLDGTVDSSAIYLRAAQVAGRTHDVFVVTTTYGKTIALDAADGRDSLAVHAAVVLPPRGHGADHDRDAGRRPEPQVDLRGVAGREDPPALARHRPPGLAPRRSRADPTHEKLASPLNLWGGRLIAATDGYIGDAPPYQGHVVTLDPATGAIIHVWNSLCSNRHALIRPSTCGSSDSAIWGRNGAVVVDTSSGRLLAGHRQRAVGRQHRLGRQRCSSCPRRVADRRQLDADATRRS